MSRLTVSAVGIAVTAGAFTIFTGLNGYCGESGYPENQCHFHTAGQSKLTLAAMVIYLALGAFGASKLPRVEGSRRRLICGAVIAACLAGSWLLLIKATTGTLAYWNGAGLVELSVLRRAQLFREAATVLAFVTPAAAWYAAGGGRAAGRVFAYGAAVSAASWSLAVAYTSWFYDRHLL